MLSSVLIVTICYIFENELCSSFQLYSWPNEQLEGVILDTKCEQFPDRHYSSN